MSVTDPTSERARRDDGRRGWMARWMAALRVVGNIQAWIILSLFYVVLVAPVGFVFRLLADPLRIRRRNTSAWIPLPSQYDRLDAAKEQS